jgi:hypothetical protein
MTKDASDVKDVILGFMISEVMVDPVIPEQGRLIARMLLDKESFKGVYIYELNHTNVCVGRIPAEQAYAINEYTIVGIACVHEQPNVLVFPDKLSAILAEKDIDGFHQVIETYRYVFTVGIIVERAQ